MRKYSKSPPLLGDIEDTYKLLYQQNTFKIQDTVTHYHRVSLLEWYKLNRRKMPWRGDSFTDDDINFESSIVTPYGTWVSEVMLQQTRVETVIKYWIKWMERFPTIEKLSQANSEEVNKYWAGLGYYRRAQQLLLGAKLVVEKYNGVLPNTRDELLKIPGIGPYTAGAIASIAYNLREPLVDGNVIRVFSRLFAVKDEIQSVVMNKLMWSLADQLVDPDHPGEFNQALMELGATICKPTSPGCDVCPLQSTCHAKLMVDYKKRSKQDNYSVLSSVDIDSLPDEVTYFPQKAMKKEPKQVRVSVCILRAIVRQKANNSDYSNEYSDSSDNEVLYLFVRRPSKGLLANQWEFPSVVLDKNIFENDKNSLLTDVQVVDEDNYEEIINESMENFIPTKMVLLNPFKDYFFNKINTIINFPHDLTSDGNIANITDNNNNIIKHSLINHIEHSPITHIFSHEKHTMYVNMYDISSDLNDFKNNYENITSSNDNNVVEWMTASQIIECGITSGCKKILNAVSKQNNEKKKRKFCEVKSIASENESLSNPPKDYFELMKQASKLNNNNKKKKIASNKK
eukprot:gene15567-21020_t